MIVLAYMGPTPAYRTGSVSQLAIVLGHRVIMSWLIQSGSKNLQKFYTALQKIWMEYPPFWQPFWSLELLQVKVMMQVENVNM
jgi:hypothetical protein